MSNYNNNRWLSVATIVLLVANIVTLLLLWNNKTNAAPERKYPPGTGPFEFLTRELQLDTSQQAAYRTLRDEHQADQRKMQDSIGRSKDALFELLQQENVPDSLLQAYSRKASVYEQQMDIITFRHFQKLRALCDPSQQKKFDALIKDVLRKMGGPKPLHRPPPHDRGEEPEGPPPPGTEEGPTQLRP